MPACRAIAAAVPTAWPIAKHGPLTRSDAWPSCVVDAQRPATKRFATPSGKEMP